jgi:hypothetical protein
MYQPSKSFQLKPQIIRNWLYFRLQDGGRKFTSLRLLLTTVLRLGHLPAVTLAYYSSQTWSSSRRNYKYLNFKSYSNVSLQQ